MQSTKISGLAVDTEYTFHLVLKTSAGIYSSEKLVVKTHKMTDLSGITVTPGVLPPQLRDTLDAAVERIGAKLVDTVRIDTTHFVCTEGRGQAWEKAVEMNIPVVRPEWVDGCEREGRIVGVRGYYLNADPRMRQVGQGVGVQQQQQQQTPQRSQQEAPVPIPLSSSTPMAEEPSESEHAGSNGEAAPAPPKKDDASSEEDDDEDDDDEDDEAPEPKIATDDTEGKIKREDKERLSPRGAGANGQTTGASSEDDEEDDEEDEGRTPGEGSFSEVAL
jgi:chitin biosynthesis protein CHS5